MSLKQSRGPATPNLDFEADPEVSIRDGEALETIDMLEVMRIWNRKRLKRRT